MHCETGQEGMYVYTELEFLRIQLIQIGYLFPCPLIQIMLAANWCERAP